MDLRQQLAAAHSRANADIILAWLLKDEARTRVLMKVVRSKAVGDAKLVQRAAMVLGDLGRERPRWLYPFQVELVNLAAAARHPAVPRAVLRYFSELPLADIVEDAQGQLLDVSFQYLGDRSAPVTHKVYGMTILSNFAQTYSELTEELRELIEREIAEGVATPGFKSRGKKILANLK